MKELLNQKPIILFFICLITVFSGFSQEIGNRATKRQAAQRVRIHEGRRHGEISNKEAFVINAEQRHIRRSKRRARADGEVTRSEKLRLERKQNRASRHISRAKHNAIDNN